MFVTPEGRLTQGFMAMPPLAGLPGIPGYDGHNIVPYSASGDNQCSIDLAEGCILTNSVSYTHGLMRWVKAVHGGPGDSSKVERAVEFDLGIIPYADFSVSDPCNLAYMSIDVRIALEVFALVALTASSSTLHGLIEMVKVDNDRRQEEMDATGYDRPRMLNFNSSSFTNPEYELVAIHPEHFLPSCALSVFHPATSTSTDYVVSRDRRLRETSEPDSPRLPTLRNITESRSKFKRLNVFLVILNAEPRFHEYLDMINKDPPTIPLPEDVLALMHLTTKLVDLLYWKPVPTKGSPGEAPFTDIEEMKQHSNVPVRRRKSVFPEDMDLETRKQYGRALMCSYEDSDRPAGI